MLIPRKIFFIFLCKETVGRGWIIAIGLMALKVSVIASSTYLRRRLPIVGAFCMLSLGLSHYSPSLSVSSKPDFSQSLLSHNILRPNSAEQKQSQSGVVRMEAEKKTVPNIVVYVTVPNKEAGKKLAVSIINEKLAACVNRVPGVESVYEWKGEIQTDSEELLIIKTRESLLQALTDHVKANHEYEVPEVIAMPIIGGNLQYLEWIKNTTRD